MVPVGGSLVTTGVGVAINVATDLKTQPWAWVAVAVMTGAGTVVGLASESLVRRRRTDESGTDRGTTVTVSGARNQVRVSAVGPGVVATMGVIVIAAVLVGQAASANSGTAPTGPATGSTSPAVARADALDIRIEHLRAFSEGWFVVFPREKSAAAREFTAIDPLPEGEDGMDAMFRRELAAGAYIALGEDLPMRMVLGFRNKLDRRIVVTGLTVENKRDARILDGTAVFVEAGASADPTAIVHLDSAYPVPRIRDDQDQEIGAYFPNRTIPINPGETATLPIELDAQAASHEFTLAVKFDIDGTQFHQDIDNNGQPFRVTPLICATQKSTSGLLYQAVHVMDYAPPDDHRTLVPIDPREDKNMC
jgi:hypothetical protein